MNSGLGPTLTIIVGAILWLVYLAPNLRDRAETRAIERDARRIAATTQELGIVPKSSMSAMTAREIAMHRRELERLSRANDRHQHRSERRAVFAAAPEIATRHRLLKLALSIGMLVSLAGVGTAMYLTAWSYLVLSVGFGLLAAIGLIAVNTNDVRPAQRQARPEPVAQPDVAVTETWTPIRTPPAHSSIPAGAGLIINPEHDKAIAARERAARIREQAARASQPGVAADSRFTEPATPVTDEIASIDITAALRARRAN